MTRSLREEYCLWGQLSTTTCSNATVVAQRATPSRSRPQLAMENGVRDGDPIDLPLPHPVQGSTPCVPLA